MKRREEAGAHSQICKLTECTTIAHPHTACIHLYIYIYRVKRNREIVLMVKHIRETVVGGKIEPRDGVGC